MTARLPITRLLTTVALVALTLLVGGCATIPAAEGSVTTVATYPADPAPAPAGLSIGEILQMLTAGRPQPEITGDIQARGVRAVPAPADLDVLLQNGAGKELIDALIAAPVVPGASPGAIVQGPPYPVCPGYYSWWPLWFGYSWGPRYYRAPHGWSGAPGTPRPPAGAPLAKPPAPPAFRPGIQAPFKPSR